MFVLPSVLEQQEGGIPHVLLAHESARLALPGREAAAHLQAHHVVRGRLAGHGHRVDVAVQQHVGE